MQNVWRKNKKYFVEYKFMRGIGRMTTFGLVTEWSKIYPLDGSISRY